MYKTLLFGYIVKIGFSVAESWVRRPLGILAGNTYHIGIYDECVDIHNPVRGQYCISEIKLLPPAGKDYSFNRTEEKDYFGVNNAWHTILGVRKDAKLLFQVCGHIEHF